jgi:hypothetical protein
MPNTSSFPFRRLRVNHVVEGGTQVWWEIAEHLLDPGPYTFQLQAGRTNASTAADWENVADPVVNGLMAVDTQKRLYGKTLDVFYRVVLTTPVQQYVSEPIYCFGSLSDKDWILAREIVRKELLLGKQAAKSGYLLKRLRYGQRCQNCLDPQTEEITNSRCPECFGTGFSTGYHPPLAFTWMLETGSASHTERRNGAAPPGQSREVVQHCRVTAFPMLNKEDIFVDADSDERWFVDSVEEKAGIRSVPLVLDVTLRLAEFTDVIYRLPVKGLQISQARMTEYLSLAGCGSIYVNHDYGGENALAYIDDTGECPCPIVGATVTAYRKEDYDQALGAPDASAIVAATHTVGNGTWAEAMGLDPGEYVLVYEKQGEYGPDVVDITVVEPVTETVSVENTDQPLVATPPAVAPAWTTIPDFGIF